MIVFPLSFARTKFFFCFISFGLLYSSRLCSYARSVSFCLLFDKRSTFEDCFHGNPILIHGQESSVYFFTLFFLCVNLDWKRIEKKFTHTLGITSNLAQKLFSLGRELKMMAKTNRLLIVWLFKIRKNKRKKETAAKTLHNKNR